MSEKNEPPVACDSWNKTTCGTEVKKTFVWTLANFENYRFQDKEMLSTIFTLPGPEECVTKWLLEFYPAVPSIVLKCLSNNVRAIPLIFGKLSSSSSCETSSSGTLKSWTWNSSNYMTHKTEK